MLHDPDEHENVFYRTQTNNFKWVLNQKQMDREGLHGICHH